MDAIGAKLIECSDSTAYELTLLENIQREDLDLLDEARGYMHLRERYNYTLDQLVRIVTKSKSSVGNIMSILTEPMEVQDAGGNADLTATHARDFLDCIKSRERPNADVEVGHRSTTMSLLANISLVAGKRIEWDAEREMITSPQEANELLHYEYRRPWKLG